MCHTSPLGALISAGQGLYHNPPLGAQTFSLYTNHMCDRNTSSWATTAILEGHTDEVWSLEWSHSGMFLATASKDKSAIIWRVGSDGDPLTKEYSPKFILRDHPCAVGCVAWSLDDSILLTSSEHSIRLWNTRTGLCLRELEAHTEVVTALAWLPDGSGFISGGLDRTIILWDVDGKQRDSWGQTPIRVIDLMVTPDFTRLVAVGMYDLPVTPLGSKTTPPESGTRGGAAAANPPHVEETGIIIYNLATKLLEKSIRLEGELTSVKISQDSQYALVNHTMEQGLSCEILLWDLNTEQIARKYTGHVQCRHIIRSCFGGIDDNFVASGSEDGQVYIWHRENGALLEVLPGHGQGSVNAVAWNPVNVRMLASCSDDMTIRIWEAPPADVLDAPADVRESGDSTKGKGKSRERWDEDGAGSTYGLGTMWNRGYPGEGYGPPSGEPYGFPNPNAPSPAMPGPPGGYNPAYSPSYGPPPGPPPGGFGGPGYGPPPGPPPGFPGEHHHQHHHQQGGYAPLKFLPRSLLRVMEHPHPCLRGPKEVRLISLLVMPIDPRRVLPVATVHMRLPGAPPRPPTQHQQYGPVFEGSNHQQQQLQFQYSQCTGKRKALCIGINYFGQKSELKGCINDARNVKRFLESEYGYKEDDIVMLTDDAQNPRQVPTFQNIIAAMQWLVRGAQPNDSLFFHCKYSGHGGQTKDLDGDEADGYDEVIYPVDFQSSGHIVDDMMHDILVKPLPPGCRLTAIFDSCHSGSVLDLPYIYSTEGKIKEPNLAAEAGQGLLSAVTSYARGDMGGVFSSVSGIIKGATGANQRAEQKARQTKTSPADVVRISDLVEWLQRLADERGYVRGGPINRRDELRIHDLTEYAFLTAAYLVNVLMTFELRRAKQATELSAATHQPPPEATAIELPSHDFMVVWDSKPPYLPLADVHVLPPCSQDTIRVSSPGVLNMYTFDQRMTTAVTNSSTKGWLVAILELGAWLGVLVSGYLADKLSRKYTIVLAVVIFCIGVIVQTSAKEASSIFGGRFVTGLGIGSLSMAVPLYNAELAPPEVRGSLVALQQLAITFGIMISFWIDYGTNYIGGTGAGQSEAAWRIPLALQLVPAIILGVGILFMPWLINNGREDEALRVLSSARNLPPDSDLVQIEFLEIKAQYLFEKETSQIKFPQYQDGSFKSNFKLGFYDYLSLLQSRPLFYRVAVGSLTMFFQQWTGVNAILYYAPSIFQDLGLTGNTTSLLATGVVGIAMFLATIPAVLYIDKTGRKPILISGALLMAACHLIVAVLTGLYHNSWDSHPGAGWAAATFVWVFAIGFGYSWGPCGWIVAAEIWPLSIRGKGVSIAASSNWMNNFIVGQVTPSMLQHIGFGTFVFFGSFTFVGALFVMFFVPETKGLSLEEMDEVFGSAGLAAADHERQLAIEKRIGLSQFNYVGDDADNSSHEKQDVDMKA
ncbi:Metacaspase-1 [Grifola frondosa]|uniref:Metacaspase-1 n=1 Tax=Grifola frondosa TaxID=5627 RepID=A0A1C7M5Y2_GRIFR|nr:Metacaspase-1 [Grifola frondosa]